MLKREIQGLCYDVSEGEDCRVTFLVKLEAVTYANVFLFTTERILSKLRKIHA